MAREAVAVVKSAAPTTQRTHEERRALFSCFYWAAYSWNRQQLPAAGAPPGATFWSALLVRAAVHATLCLPAASTDRTGAGVTDHLFLTSYLSMKCSPVVNER